MKYLLLLTAFLVSFSLMTTAGASRPCKTIAEACFSAGVIHRGESEQMIINSCIKPVVYGRGIRGVNVDSTVINACRAKLGARR